MHPRSSPQRYYSEIARLALRGKIGVVHAHNLYSAALALSARWKYGYKVLLDYHGRIPEEYLYLGKGGAGSRWMLEKLESTCVRRADRVVVVSDKLRDYVRTAYRVPDSRLTVIPCCADSGVFRWDAALRREARGAMGLEDKFVCAHVGSFFEWYEPERLTELFKEISTAMPNAHLLVVTPAVRETAGYLTARLSAGTFTVKSAKHEEVPALLNASDLGFLLLRQSPNIKTSSPAKFSEYLNCGLPVVITREVGDFSDLVERTGTGRVVGNDARLGAQFVRDVASCREYFAERCVAAARPLVWESYRETWLKILAPEAAPRRHRAER
jgi:glycosyltransferase involved in cell wall biosynthesis